MQFFEPGHINLIIDLQWGSTGKGAISRYLAEKEGVEVAICQFSPNSAHTSVEADGTAHIVKQLPQAAALVHQGADIELMIGADACINPSVLEGELERFKNAASKLRIHPNAVIITDECIERERASLVRISSTLQGTAFAKAMKLTRDPNVVLARNHPLTKQFVDDGFDDRLHDHLLDGKVILGDFHQGYELSINSKFYPFVTSSTVNTSQFLSSLNLPPSTLGTVVGTARTMPIRVGNVKDEQGNTIGYSGDVYDDQRELTWNAVQQ
jgi:adenylosuccinate synthase